MRYVNIGRYQVSFVILLIAFIISPIVFAAVYYLWGMKTIPLSVNEPLSIIDSPSSIHVHPGENQTLDISIMNSATVNYTVTLTFALNDTAYQESYVQFSDYSYIMPPGTNNVTAWISIDKKAPPAWLELSVYFYRE